MKDLLLKKVDSLPPLPKTVIELEEFKKSDNKEPAKLLEIVEKDPLIVSTLLKVSNSAMFGFRSSVETPSRAVNLLGVNFTISIALGSVIQNSLNTNLTSYGISSDDFMKISNMASTLVGLWVSKIDFNLKEELLLPAFLQETGKFIISDIINEEGKSEQFLAALKKSKCTADVETEFLNTSTAQITSSIFKHWKLSENLINSIEYVDNLKECPEKYLKSAQILHIIKILCNVVKPLSDENIELAITKAKEFNLGAAHLQKAIEKLQDRLLDE